MCPCCAISKRRSIFFYAVIPAAELSASAYRTLFTPFRILVILQEICGILVCVHGRLDGCHNY